MTPTAIALNDLVQTMEAIDRLYDKPELNDLQDRVLSTLEDRRSSLETQLQQLVGEQLGVDYGVLWHAVTPSGVLK